jgi:hypothetical protein
LLAGSGDVRTLLEGVREVFSLALVRETEHGRSEALISTPSARMRRAARKLLTILNTMSATQKP